MTSGAAATKLELCVRTLQRWAKNNLVPCCRTPTGRYLFSDRDIAAIAAFVTPEGREESIARRKHLILAEIASARATGRPKKTAKPTPQEKNCKIQNVQ